MSNAYNVEGKIIVPDGSRFVDSRPHKAEDYRRAHTPIVNEHRKIGRNEPCPCGSGLKYKKCHGG